MFTGLVEDIGILRSRTRRGEEESLVIETRIPTNELILGESIAVNGCCLTVTAFDRNTFSVDASSETMRLTSLGAVRIAEGVHLERAMKLGGRLGGHLVQGHVDGVGKIERIVRDGRSWQVYIQVPEALRPEVVAKGSITVDGISLTVNELTPTGCRLTIIPFTGDETLLTRKDPGTPINIETDVIGKYVRHLLNFGAVEAPSAPKNDTAALLRRYGYLPEET